MKIFTKTILLLTFLGLSFNKVNGQYVTIPDANFVTWLTSNYPQCMSGNQMDTTCSAIVNEDKVNINYLPISNLHGIKFFDNIDTLIISYCSSLTYLPSLPNTLKFLESTFNYNLSNMDTLPKTLRHLNCDANHFQSLPNLPDSLRELICSQNFQLTSLPLLPNHLELLNCWGNNMNITSLPTLPNSLKILYCSGNPIGNLPTLPNSLKSLTCNSCNISNLPSLPNALENLDCSYNNIATLPTLPNQLIKLFCVDNQLTNLPILPASLTELACDNNNISCFASFSNSLILVDIYANPFTCLPNYVPAMDSATLATPLCAAGNANGCPVATTTCNTCVTIPDANFVTWLTNYYPSCMNGNQMDTTCNAILTTSLVYLSFATTISDLTGIQYFDNLHYLHCAYTQITSLPPLPKLLRELYCDYAQLTSLPALPDSLRILHCPHNQITSLPALPNSLTHLRCPDNLLTSLPPLPDSLIVLWCGENQLTSLPVLPIALDSLWCDDNQLTTLPSLPDSLKGLTCSNNNISCFPPFPLSIVSPYLYMVSNPVTCLPNYIPAMDAATLALPLCQANDALNNPNNCPAAIQNCSTCVTIPDANFVTWLTNYYPSCMNGNQMDTTCAAIVNETNLSVNDPNQLFPDIADLTGVQYFDNLQVLDCSYNLLTSLPSLPNTLTDLICFQNQLTSLPLLPNSLTLLQCHYNQLTTLPTLPNSITELNCRANQLTNLPTLPSSLTHLDCVQNQLTVLPALPNSLTHLNCGNNLISSLPTLSTSLVNLECNFNNLTVLPALPASLILLVCQGNQLTNLPALPNVLQTLGCTENQLITLPALPNSLTDLICSYNQLSSLPTLPNSLLYLMCDHNNILCFPTFPSSLNSPVYFNISNNPFSCLPNYVSVMDAATLAIPLCAAGNANGCAAASGILGNIYKENTVNCMKDSTDLNNQNVQVKFFNPITNQFGATYSAINGVYNYPANAGTYFVLVDTLNKPYKANCTHPGIDSTVVTTISNPLANNVNFDIACKPGLDLNVQSINHKDGLVFPGQQHTLQVMVGDASQWYGLNCASGTSGQVQITITGAVTYNGNISGSLVPSVNGNVYTYSIADFGIINNANDFQLLLTTDSTAQLGNQICVHVEVTPLIGDINPVNNTMDYCYTVVNSYDPNYKEVYPTDVEPLFQDWLTYTIHFQNTGTAPAINIRLLDTLDSNLDAQTFELINYSHYNTVTLMDSILDFRFPNILLPDSASDLAGSQGFVQYRIKPKANLPVGTQILNKANIYFDFNAPITTNTTVNNFTTTVSTMASSPWGRKEVGLYPNPSNGLFNISALANVEVYNLVGELILSQNKTTSIDLTNEPKGIYFVKLNGSTIKKLIKN